MAQMTASAVEELQHLINEHNWRHGRKHKVVANATQDDRAHTLFLMFRQLHQKLDMPMRPRSFRLKHVRAIVRYWEKTHLSAATLQKRFSYMQTFSKWIGKQGLIPGTLADYLANPALAARTYAAQHDKSWEARGIVPLEKIAAIDRIDKYVGAQLRLQHSFGLRMKEAVMCRPALCDRGDVLQVKEGTKGGRERLVPIDSPEKRAALDHAKRVLDARDHHLGNPRKSLKQNLTRYYTVLRKVGITRAELGVTGHGLRVGYGLTLYEQRAGASAPVRHGATPAKAFDESARLEVAQHYGHGRKSISTAYVGGLLHKRSNT